MRRTGMQSTLCFFVVTAVAMAGLIPASAESRLTFAQAGSTGGTIGKQDKSASGGEQKLRPRRTRKQVLLPSKPERQVKRMPAKTSATPRLAVGGRWNWSATCAFGNWGGVITIVQTTASSFHGSFGHQGPADNGIITDGKIHGKHISFLRRTDEGVLYERFDANLVSTEPPTLDGHVVDPAAGACHFTGTKM